MTVKELKLKLQEIKLKPCAYSDTHKAQIVLFRYVSFNIRYVDDFPYGGWFIRYNSPVQQKTLNSRSITSAIRDIKNLVKDKERIAGNIMNRAFPASHSMIQNGHHSSHNTFNGGRL